MLMLQPRELLPVSRLKLIGIITHFFTWIVKSSKKSEKLRTIQSEATDSFILKYCFKLLFGTLLI